jgi:hypothetical protein
MYPAKYVKSEPVHGIEADSLLTKLQEKELCVECNAAQKDGSIPTNDFQRLVRSKKPQNHTGDRDGADSTATRYGLGCLRIESRWRRDFSCHPDGPRGPHNPYRIGTCSSPGVKRLVMLNTHLLLTPGCEWVGAIAPSQSVPT